MKFSIQFLSFINAKVGASKSYFLVTVLGIFSFMFFTNCTSDNQSLESSDTEGLTAVEIENLKFLREEEKLARDVYLYSYDKYGNNIFKNIANSEQQHMNQVLTILNTYKIVDPASSEIGVFSDATIQKLYDDLTSQSNTSLIEALKVGAYIEDFDINDLVTLNAIIEKKDIEAMIDMLYCGSKNHLRSYVNQLSILNTEYQPEFITVAAYNLIIESGNESCGK